MDDEEKDVEQEVDDEAIFKKQKGNVDPVEESGLLDDDAVEEELDPDANLDDEEVSLDKLAEDELEEDDEPYDDRDKTDW
ncbi:MAG: hypothetical protein WCK48_03910 [bacterium]